MVLAQLLEQFLQDYVRQRDMAIYWTLVVDSLFEDLYHQERNTLEVFRDLDHFGVSLFGSLIVLSCVACFAILTDRKG